MKRFYLLGVLALCAALFIGASGEYRRVTGSKVVTFLTTDTGDTLMWYYVEAIAASDIDDSSWYIDTILGDSVSYVTPAKVITITPTWVMDSARYYDSVDGTVDAGADTVSFLTPVYAMYLTPVFDTSLTYKFQLIYASVPDTVGFTFDAGSAGATIDSLAELIDSLIDSLTGIAGIADSVTAHDSVTYIKLIAKYATETHGGRWSVRSDPPIDPRMSPRTGGRLVQSFSASNATVAMICDTLVAKHNALATTSDSILATDFGTYFTLSTKEGDSTNTLNLPGGWSVSMYLETASGVSADSATDTSTTTEATIASVVQGIVATINSTAYLKDTVEAFSDADTAYEVISRRYKRFAMQADDRFTITDSQATANDTVFGVSAVTDSVYIANLEGFTTIHARMTIGQATGHDNLGVVDSAKVLARSQGPAGNWTIDSLSNVAVPLTDQFVIGHLKGDSILGEHLYFKYHYMDTVSDSAGVVISIPLSWDILLK